LKLSPPDAGVAPRYTGIRTFARAPHVTSAEEADVAIVGVPFDTGVTFRVGGRFGPNAVRAASVLLRPYDPVLDVENCRRALGELLAAFIARHPEQCALVAFDRGGGAHMPDEAARRGQVSRAAILEPEA